MGQATEVRILVHADYVRISFGKVQRRETIREKMEEVRTYLCMSRVQSVYCRRSRGFRVKTLFTELHHASGMYYSI